MLFFELFDEVVLYQLSEIENNFKNLYFNDGALHDLRVSIRRFLSYVVCFKKYINVDDEILNNAKFFLQSSNALRDIETLIEKINTLETFEQDLEPLKNYLTNEYNLQKSILHSMLSINLDNFLLKTKSLIAQKSYKIDSYSNCKFEDLAQKTLIKYAKKIKNIKPQKNNLHKLRIMYKKYRYILEIYAKANPNNQKIDYLIIKLKQLQDKLGNIQDLISHINYLKDIKEKLPQSQNTIDALIKTFKGITKQDRKKIKLLIYFFNFFELEKKWSQDG